MCRVFATLSNGQVVTIDVDDWDGPCRRLDPLSTVANLTAGLKQPGPADFTAAALVGGPFSSIVPPQPPWPESAGDVNAYHVPVGFQSAYTDSPVSLEWFFPVAALHRLRPRSSSETRSDERKPRPLLAPACRSSSSVGAPVATEGSQAVPNPSLVPTDSPFVDPSLVSEPAQPGSAAAHLDVLGRRRGRLRFEARAVQPRRHARRSLLVGRPAGPNRSRLGDHLRGDSPRLLRQWREPARHRPGSHHAQRSDPVPVVTLSNTNAFFCSKGVEDFSLGQQRAQSELAVMTAASSDRSRTSTCRSATTSRLTDDVRDPSDTYWTLPNSCWAENPDAGPGQSARSHPRRRSRRALQRHTYGYILDPTNPSLQRDFPIIEAYDDHLVIGRFAYQSGQVAPRVPGGQLGRGGSGSEQRAVPDADAVLLRQPSALQRRRTGGQWSAVGSVSGFMNHVGATGEDARCAPTYRSGTRRSSTDARRQCPRPYVAGGETRLTARRSYPRLDATASSRCAIRCCRCSSGTGRT